MEQLIAGDSANHIWNECAVRVTAGVFCGDDCHHIIEAPSAVASGMVREEGCRMAAVTTVDMNMNRVAALSAIIALDQRTAWHPLLPSPTIPGPSLSPRSELPREAWEVVDADMMIY